MLGRAGVENAVLYKSQTWFYKVYKRSGNLGHIQLSHLKMLLYQRVTGESNDNLPLRTCPGRSVPEPYRSPD
jgi:hypothetical protein